MGRAATGLVVNTLTVRRGEAPHAFLRRSGLEPSLLPTTPLTLWPECGVPHANRRGRFNGVTLAFLGLQIPEGKEVPFQAWPGVRTVEGTPAFRGGPQSAAHPGV